MSLNKKEQIKLIESLTPDEKGIELVVDYLGAKVFPVAPIGKEKFDGFFEINRPRDIDGLFAYIIFDVTLTIKTAANRFKTLFDRFSNIKKMSGNNSIGQLDFLIIVGEKRLLIFDINEYSSRLDLSLEKLNRKTDKYNLKLESIRFSNVADKYTEDFFTDTTLEEFSKSLFRFPISDDKAFEIRTKKLRQELMVYITKHTKAQNILVEKVIHDDIDELDYTNRFHKEIISAVTDTLVLRQILVRILEGRYGYTEKEAHNAIKNLGLGSSLDNSISKKKNIDLDSEKELQNMKKPIDSIAEQMELFESVEIQEVEPDSDESINQLREDFINSYSVVYGGDLYVGDVAEAATQIELLLTPNEWSKMWHWTSNDNFDFDLADVSPSTIGEQYEQTMGNELKEKDGYLYYDKDKRDQKMKGAFYTQEKITEYILEESLGRKLREVLAELEQAPKSKKELIIDKFLSLKVADITSGGGSFLAGAVKRIGNCYNDILIAVNDERLIKKYSELDSKQSLQKYAVNSMVYGIDIDLKALIVSSFALGLETMYENSEQLPQLLGKTLLHTNSLVSAIDYENRTTFFKIYNSQIIELRQLRLLMLKNEVDFEVYNEKRQELQNIFLEQMLLKNKKLNKKILEDKLVEVLEINLTEVFFDEEGHLTEGFDVIFGNPPYISLQKFENKEKDLYKFLGGFETYEARGDIYTLFYERSIKLLKTSGYLGFVTSNKWMRAAYGKSIRNYLLEKTNPILLVDLGDNMFNATVDTNILIVEKSENQNILKVTDLSRASKDPKKRIENMSDYIKQNSQKTSFTLGNNWTILSSVEKSIKEKIEQNGIPLREWKININRGILTGLNQAFIIDKTTRQKLITQDPKSDQLIHPILRGRDIKKYGYTFAEQYVIYIPWHFPLENEKSIRGASLLAEEEFKKNFPSIYNHLFQYKELLSNRNKSEVNKRYEWYALQRYGSNYMDDFFKQKIVFSRIPGDSPCFAMDKQKMILNDTGYIITGENLEYLLAQLTSDLIWFAFKRFYMGGGIDKEFKLNNLLDLPVPKPGKMIELTVSEQEFIKSQYSR
ncbi:Eco57I restriction-modification methylase domain-containing protein [Enterococcus sp. BWB1-3]|uniref:Eco57I restriction-modification methylase domain-containing protein n=1 Tax=Enterococcus sp. BWB1-3 TaxID=2787713 RepID=UPI001920B1F6|nr:Eco57I restriction-modification methylase domain-containing protein [Enterococcus sp. BWB1-3]MBL1230239.1 Eco57I restriction-modification methylase domain-containing protein [Enterococcus sp. BWB1-3]